MVMLVQISLLGLRGSRSYISLLIFLETTIDDSKLVIGESSRMALPHTMQDTSDCAMRSSETRTRSMHRP